MLSSLSQSLALFYSTGLVAFFVDLHAMYACFGSHCNLFVFFEETLIATFNLDLVELSTWGIYVDFPDFPVSGHLSQVARAEQDGHMDELELVG